MRRQNKYVNPHEINYSVETKNELNLPDAEN